MAELLRRVAQDANADPPARLVALSGLGQAGGLAEVRVLRPLLAREQLLGVIYLECRSGRRGFRGSASEQCFAPADRCRGKRRRRAILVSWLCG